MKYFGRIIKHYIILALERSGAHVDPDTHAELDAAMLDLEQGIRRIVAEVIAEQANAIHVSPTGPTITHSHTDEEG